MQKSMETTGATRDAAIEEALKQLGLERDDVSVEVLDNGKKGFLGFGATPARVRVTYEVPDEPAKPAAPAPVKTEPVQEQRPPRAERRPAEAKEKTERKPAQPDIKPLEYHPLTPALFSSQSGPDRKARQQEYREEFKAELEEKAERRPAQTRPNLSHIDPNDPRLTTPHLVKAAPPKGEGDRPREARSERPRRERSDRPRREPREPREPRPPRQSQPREEKPVIPVSPEAMEKVTAEAIRFISGLLRQMGIEAEVQVREQLVADQLRLEIVGKDMGPVIGRRGDTLDAIQYLTSLVMGRVTEEHVRLSVDTENYRVKRAESLERLARKMAAKAVQYRKPMVLEPMNPYERRIIHSTLQDYAGVTTYSTGSEPGRRVVISPEGSRRGYRPRGGR